MPLNWHPGLPDPKNPTYAEYSEKLLVGYRFYDYHNISFTTGRPFGYGLRGAIQLKRIGFEFWF